MNKQVRFGFLLGLTMAVVSAVPAMASITTYFGEDLGLGEATPLAAFPIADAASASFQAALIGVSTESFEGIATGTVNPTLTFGAVTATMSSAGSFQPTVEFVPSGSTNGLGRYATDGEKFLATSSDSFELLFSAPQAAFGFFGIDIGDFAGTVSVTTVNSGATVYAIPHTVGGAGGAVLFWGIIDTTNLFTSVTFTNSGAGVDGFGFDEMTIGGLANVAGVIPAPAAVWLGAAGLGLVGLIRRRLS
jgi:hypothetical protein